MCSAFRMDSYQLLWKTPPWPIQKHPYKACPILKQTPPLSSCPQQRVVTVMDGPSWMDLPFLLGSSSSTSLGPLLNVSSSYCPPWKNGTDTCMVHLCLQTPTLMCTQCNDHLQEHLHDPVPPK